MANDKHRTPSKTTVELPKTQARLPGDTDALPTASATGPGPPADLRVPRTVAGYAVEKLLGLGGMGEVFLARDPKLERPIALKRIRTRLTRHPVTRDRFIQEARITAMLQHPSVIPVYDFAEAESGVYYTMRPVEGTSLADLVARLRVDERERVEEWTVAHLIRLFLQAAGAIAYAHSRGVIHRDLKPANIMIGPFEEVLVLDWGVAKVIGTGAADGRDQPVPGDGGASTPQTQAAFLGTPLYLAPEVLQGEPATVQSDIFALGVILYELLALQAPWRADCLDDLLKAMETPPPLPSRLQPSRNIPRELEDVALRAIGCDPDSRHDSVSRFSHDVARALEGRMAWMPVEAGAQTAHWQLTDGRLKRVEGELVFASRGRRNMFRYMRDENLAGSLRVSFEMFLPRGRHSVSVLLNTAAPRSGLGGGYCLHVAPGRSRSVSLLRSGRAVTGASAPVWPERTWQRVVVERIDGRLSLRIGGEEIYSHVDPIPLRGGGVGIIGRSTTGVHVRNLVVSFQGVSSSVSCLAVPDAFFNRQLYDEARDEYERIALSLPGRREGREAAFRAGLCLVESARADSDRELRQLYLEEAKETFVRLLDGQPSCLLDLGRAVVAAESRDAGTERDALLAALTQFPGDPQLPMVREWVLARLHSSSGRLVTAELLPLALRHCMAGAGQRVVGDVVRDIRKSWEMPPFMGSRLQGRSATPTGKAEALLFFGFWSGRGRVVVDAARSLAAEGLLDERHASDAVFALLELGLLDAAEHVLHLGCGERNPSHGAWLAACRSAVAATRGDVEAATRFLADVPPNPASRIFNSARLMLARAEFAHGDDKGAIRTLRPRAEADWIASEHRAWVRLMTRNARAARRELAPLVDTGRHEVPLDMTNLLHGTCLIMENREREARAVFELLPVYAYPRTWTLGSHYATGRLGGGDLGAYLADAFPWERRQLYTQLALLAQARDEEDVFKHYTHLARRPIAG